MDPETQREFIGDIGREADRLGRLTQKLLTLTKLDSSVEEEREILDAAPVVRKVVRMLLPLARLRGIGIDTTFEPDCSVMTVEDDLYQIVFNLTENAIKYNRQDGWVGVSVRRAGDQVELRVEDNGAGIPAESMEHIFERFLPRGQGTLPRRGRRRAGPFHRARHGRAQLRHHRRAGPAGRRHDLHRAVPAF